MDILDDEYIFLPSNASMDVYPDNALNDYTIRLSQPIELEGRWEAALTELSYPGSMVNIYEPVQVCIKKFIGRISGSWQETGYSKGDSIPAGHYTITSLVKAVNEEINHIFLKMYPRVTNPPWPPPTPELQINTLSKRITMKIPYIEPSGNGNNPGYYIPYFETKAKELELLQLFGFPTDIRPLLVPATTYRFYILLEAPYEHDIRNGAHFIHVYTDIIAPVNVGHTKAELLRAVAVTYQKETEGLVSERFVLPYYLPVALNRIETITILLTDETGRKIKFSPGRVLAVLHLRRIQSF